MFTVSFSSQDLIISVCSAFHLNLLGISSQFPKQKLSTNDITTSKQPLPQIYFFFFFFGIVLLLLLQYSCKASSSLVLYCCKTCSCFLSFRSLGVLSFFIVSSTYFFYVIRTTSADFSQKVKRTKKILKPNHIEAQIYLVEQRFTRLST